MNQSPLLSNPVSDQKAKANSAFRFTLSNDIFSDPDVINPFDNLVIFGDSLSDKGNLYQASGNTFPPLPYYQGRFSNGPIWVDYFTDNLEFSNESVRNFAFGGANTGLNNVFGGYTVPGLLTEIEQFKAINAVNPVSEDTLYVIWAGANDFLNPPADPVQAVKDAIANISNAIATLTSLGAKEFVVANLTDLGVIPLSIDNNNSAKGTAISLAFNNALSQALDNLEIGLNIDTSLVDIFGLSASVQANPEIYNFTNLTERLITATGNVNPDEYAFWDDVHPTTRLHQLVYQTFAETLLDDGIIPDLIRYSATLADGSDLPHWLRFNSITGEFIGTPTDENVGSVDVKVIATDKEGLTATDIFSLQIQGINISVSEENSGINTKPFTVFLDEASTESITVNYQTVPITATPVSDTTKEVFAAILEGSQEVPGITTTATGLASAELDTAAATFSYQLEVTGLDFNNQTETTEDDVILAHIHNAVRGVNGPVDFDILADDDKQITVENSKTIITGIWEAEEGLTPEEIETLKSAATGADTPYYFNIHTTTNPGGELRGQIVSTAPDYISTSGTLTFAPGETSKTIEVPIFGDAEIESDETFKIVLSDVNDSSLILGEQLITIRDDDHPSRKLSFGTPNGEELNPEPGKILFAGDGDDTINSTDDNQIFAGDGNDFVTVNSDSFVSAGDGNDTVIVGVDKPAHETIVNGGNGKDMLFVAEADGTNIMFGAADADELTVIEGSNQLLFGGSGDDKIVSQGSNNRLFGGSGIDVLVSNLNDLLSGGNGDDVLFAGEAGGNKLTGGAGTDQFWVANGSLPITKNTVTDFTIGVDKIGFGGVEILSFGQVIKEQMGADTLLKINTTEIALLAGINASSLTANDFAFSASVVSI
ncbi:MAG: CHRD domain-containing protein [Nostocales cyanobacterium]|nr:MAG: CHRD domain-containing protein [Nostocales cyanobacterium]